MYGVTFWRGTAERAVKTGAQMLLSLLTVGTAITAIAWQDSLAITATAMLMSVLTSIADHERADTAIATGAEDPYHG